MCLTRVQNPKNWLDIPFPYTQQRKMELVLRFLLVALLGLLSGADPATSYYSRNDGYGRKEVVVTNEDR